MKDRVPTKPNRYAVYDDSHNFLRYEYHERADEPTTVGTPLNKANLLADAVKALLWPSGSVPTDPSINDVFSRLSAGLLYDNGAVKNMLGQLVTLPVSQLDNPVHIATGSYTGTGTYGSANPCSLTFNFVPKLVFIQAKTAYYGTFLDAIVMCPQTGRFTYFINSSTGAFSTNHCSLSANAVSWWNDDDGGSYPGSRSCNISGINYGYIALG